MIASEHPTIETLFSNLDRWRHFAGFPLEECVDALIGLFLPKVIEGSLGVGEMHPMVIPQFPLKKSDNNQSDKVDFLALTKDGGRAFLIELKTDMGSRREVQLEYLRRARDRGMACILSELKEIAKASKSRKKYLHLLNALSEMGLLTLPRELEEMMLSGKTRGSTKLIADIDVRHSTAPQIQVIFVQPRKDEIDGERGFRYISFREFAYSIEKFGQLGNLLARYLRKWKSDPGKCPAEKA